jgi:hypothetical protein
VNWLRRKIARAIWDAASFIYPYARFELDTQHVRGWEITAYLECTEGVAVEAFDRMGAAVCGAEHHHLDTCPGPLHVMGMHPAEVPEGAE